MAIKDCIDEIRKLAGEDLTPRDVEDIAEEVQRRADAKMRTDKLLSDQEAMDQAADEVATDMRNAAAIQARNKALNIVRRQRVKEFVQQAVDTHGLRPDEAIEALNVGINKKLPGGRLSVDARQKALHAEFLGGLMADLEKENLLEYLTRRLGVFGRDGGIADRDIARALWSIDKDGKVTADVPKELGRAAEIIWKHQEATRLRSNRAGSFIRRTPGYIVRQSHDQTLIRRAGMQGWIDHTLPLLDTEKTFTGADPRKFMEGAYTGLASGKHLKTVGGEDDLAFHGPGNLAKKMSQERVLQFKDADSWLAYNEKFGARSLIEAVFSGFEHRAKDIGLMETWGTNPRAEFENTLQGLAFEHRGNPDFSDRLGRQKLKNQFDELDGTAQRVDSVQIASAASTVRALQSMAKLGGSTISSISDIATAAGELRWQGAPLGSAYASIVGDLMHGKGSGEMRQLAQEIGVGFESATSNVLGRFSANDSPPGTMSKLMRLYFKANLLSWWTDSVKSGAARMMAFRAAGETGKVWDKVDPRLRDALGSYGFDKERWAVIRRAELKQADGKKYLTPQAVRDLPDEAFATLGAKTPKAAQKLRDELSTNLQAFYVDRTDTAVVTPGAREKAMLRAGTVRGTWMGEATRFVMQFKAFPVTFASKVIGRDLEGMGLTGLLKGKGDVLGIAHTIAATTVMGLLSMEAKEILKGRSPRDPFGDQWAQTWTAALTQGGGLGIYGDYLFGDFSRFGNSPLETVAGPDISTAADAIKILSDLRAGAGNSDDFLERRKAVPAELLRFGVGNTPFLNLFYTRVALDYLVLYNLQEMVSPGYLKRSERNLKRENDQTYIFPPSQYAQ